MKNINRIANKSKGIVQTDWSTYLPLYYSPTKNEVYTTEANDRFLLTYLIRPNTPEEIKEAVNKYMRM
jgi:hypothetical protein